MRDIPPTGKEFASLIGNWAARHIRELVLAAGYILLAYTWWRVVALVMAAQVFGSTLFESPAQADPYQREVASLITGREYPSLGWLIVASLVAVIAVFWKRLRYPAFALAVAVCLFALVTLTGNSALFERLKQEPYQPQLALLEEFSSPASWRANGQSTNAGQYPYYKRFWRSDDALGQVCNELKDSLREWAGPQMQLTKEQHDEKSCVFRFSRQSNEVEAMAEPTLPVLRVRSSNPTEDQVRISITVESTTAVSLEDFL